MSDSSPTAPLPFVEFHAFRNGNDAQVQNQRENAVNGRPPPVPRATLRPRPSTAKKTWRSPTPFTSMDRSSRRERCGDTGKSASKAPSQSRPVNRRLLESPTVGVRKQKPHSPTRTTEFCLRTNERAKAHGRPGKAKKPYDLRKCFEALSANEDTTSLPPRKPGSTAIQPFRFETDRIDKEYKEKHRRKLEQENEERRKAAEFRASAMPNFKRPVFHPVLGERRATEPENVQLKTSRRIEERKHFDAYLKFKEEERQELLRQRESEKQRLEEEELRKLRNAMTHQAQPVKRGKPFQVKHDLCHVTIPFSPRFRVDIRLNQRPPSRNQ